MGKYKPVNPITYEPGMGYGQYQALVQAQQEEERRRNAVTYQPERVHPPEPREGRPDVASVFRFYRPQQPAPPSFWPTAYYPQSGYQYPPAVTLSKPSQPQQEYQYPTPLRQVPSDRLRKASLAARNAPPLGYITPYAPQNSTVGSTYNYPPAFVGTQGNITPYLPPSYSTYQPPNPIQPPNTISPNYGVMNWSWNGPFGTVAPVPQTANPWLGNPNVSTNFNYAPTDPAPPAAGIFNTWDRYALDVEEVDWLREKTLEDKKASGNLNQQSITEANNWWDINLFTPFINKKDKNNYGGGGGYRSYGGGGSYKPPKPDWYEAMTSWRY